MSNYKQKYLKYKQKYLESKKNITLTDLHGGAYLEDYDDVIKYVKEKAFEVAERMMDRRGLVFTPLDKNILTTVFEQTILYRTN